MKKIIILSSILLLGIASLAVAQERTPIIRHRQIKQQERIQQGKASGELTPREAHKLEKRQRAINQEKKAAKADGVVTPQERRKIRHDQRKASKQIYHEKHDVQTR